MDMILKNAISFTHALEVAVKRKNIGRTRGGDITVQSFFLAVESLGGWHELAVGEIMMLAAALVGWSGHEEMEARAQLFQRLAISEWQGGSCNSLLYIAVNFEAIMKF